MQSRHAWPKAATAHFMRVGLLHHPVARLGIALGLGVRAPGKPGDRQIEAAPEEMDRTDLAEKLASESVSTPGPPEARIRQNRCDISPS